METPLQRLTRTMNNVTVTITQLMGMHPEVCLRFTNRQWECTQAAPEVWFGEPFLSSQLSGNPWSRAGDYVKLNAANGSWIWKLTNDTTTATNIDGMFEMRRAVWPD